MKKTVTVNISGIIFHIDEDAFEKLNKYLDSLRKHFSSEEGGEEILFDIESRIAEMLQAKIGSRKEVVVLSDVNEVISQLGEPSEIGREAAEAEVEPEYEKQYSRDYKKLFRDPDNKILAGVAGGLSAYLNIDPVWVRIAFVVFTFFWGFGPLVYLILWIIVPKARTTADRLSMKGERVNISNIEKSIKEDLNDLKVKFEQFSEEKFGRSKKKRVDENPSTNGFENAITNLFNVFFKIIAVIIGFAFMILGVTLLSVLLISIISGYSGVENLPWFFSVHWFMGLFFEEQWLINIAITGLGIVIGIPIIMIISAGAGMTFRLKSKNKFWGISAFILWQIGLIFCVFSLIYAFKFSESKSKPDKNLHEINHEEFNESKELEESNIYYIDEIQQDSIN